MEKIKVNLGKRSYSIFVVRDKIGKLTTELQKMLLPDNVLVVTMNKLFKLYGKKIKTELENKGLKLNFELIPDGEKSKSFSQLKESVINISQMVEAAPFFIISFGGGVVGDLSGFIASTYKRGVKYIQVPTTLLAQVDSSIGGKVGVDLETGKNLVGSFYQPELVYSDISFLKTLPEREVRNGLAEVIKYGVIKDEEIFRLLEDSQYDSKKGALYEALQENLQEIIYRCAKIKSDIVSKDEKDNKGIRAILNFGHTIGHAIEAAFSYSDIYKHGEAVSIGMVCTAEISQKLGELSQENLLLRLESLLQSFNLPIYIENIEVDEIIEYFWYDKKFVKGTPRMILPKKIGKVKVVDDIPEDLVKKVIRNRIKKKKGE